MKLKNEEGSVLISTFGLLLFLSFLITSATLVIRHQVIQFNQISTSYEAKAMIEMTEHLFLENQNKEEIKSGVVTFSNGSVIVTEMSERVYFFKATLNNNYTSQATLILPEPLVEEEPEEPIEDTSDTVEENN